MKISADRKRKRPAKTIVWTTHPPPAARAAPQDIMTKRRRISDEALAAESEKDFFSLFFTVIFFDISTVMFRAVLRILIRIRIHMFLGLPDPDRIHLSEVWIRSRILLSSCKNSKKLDSYYFVTLLTFYLWKIM